MILQVQVGEDSFRVRVPEEVLDTARPFFARLDADMDRGWQMSRTWVDAPDPRQRCQIVAERLLTALEQDNRQLVGLLAAYILQRLPGTARAIVDTTGDMTQTLFEPG